MEGGGAIEKEKGQQQMELEEEEEDADVRTTGRRLLLEGALEELEEGLMWVGVAAALAGAVIGACIGTTMAGWMVWLSFERWMHCHHSNTNNWTGVVLESDPLVMLLGASTLLFVLAPRGDLSGLWPEALCRAAARMMGGPSFQEGDGVKAMESLALVSEGAGWQLFAWMRRTAYAMPIFHLLDRIH